jgi:GNAT superfamily N-acetyltransferase
MPNKEINIRFAREDECGVILSLINSLAVYEKMEDDVAATVEDLHTTLFVNHDAEVLLAEYRGEVVGFALFFHNFSTFLGKAGLYLEDLFVKEEARGKGIGKSLLQALTRIATERNYGRMEWCCLNWNQKSIDFYLHIGARPLDDWKPIE